MAVNASCRITQVPALGLRTECTCTSNPGPSSSSPAPAFTRWTSALSRVPSQTARRCVGDLATALACVPTDFQGCFWESGTQVRFRRTRRRAFGPTQAAESVPEVSQESGVESGQNGQDSGNGKRNGSENRKRSVTGKRIGSVNGKSNGSVNGKINGSENRKTNGNAKSNESENGVSNASGMTTKEFDGVVKRQGRSGVQRVEWWRIDGAPQATEEAIERVAGPRGRLVGWMREAHGEESDGEELWTWKASTQTLHMNGNAMHKRLEDESNWDEEATVEESTFEEATAEVSENGAVAGGYLRESVVVRSVNEGSVNEARVNRRTANGASDNGVANSSNSAASSQHGVGELLRGVSADSANAGSEIAGVASRVLEKGHGAKHMEVAQIENGRSEEKSSENGRARTSEAASAAELEMEALLERTSKKEKKKKKKGSGAKLEKKKNALGKKKGKKGGKELEGKSGEGVHVVDDTGARVRMYPGPGYVDRMQNQKLAVLSSPTDTVRHKKDKLSSGGVKTGGNEGLSADNLEERLLDLRRKAIEHKDRHEGESGTLVVPTRQPILVLMRHGQSMWNELKLFTGDVDIPLTEKGVMEALSGGRTVKDVDFDIVFTSRLLRAKQTAMLALTQNSSHVVPVLVRGGYHGEGRIGDGNRLRLREAAMYALDKAACKTVPVYAHSALNERCYGDLQGLNKEEAAREFGKEMVQKWRRSNDTSPPGGESLVDTAQRARKYYVNVIEPRLAEGKNVLVVTHGNVMRGLIAYLASLEQDEMLTLEIATAFPYAYAFSRESGDYAQCCLMKPMEDFITGEPLEDKPMGLASVLKKKNFDSLI